MLDSQKEKPDFVEALPTRKDEFEHITDHL
jgi:hypothetical protein